MTREKFLQRNLLQTIILAKMMYNRLFTDFARCRIIKVGLLPSKKHRVICLIESPLKTMKNAFYFNL